jgi:type IV secretory pathway VirB2 component (pilin)
MRLAIKQTASKRVGYLGLLAVCFLLATPAIANAQATFLSGLLNWVQGNVITTLGTLAIIVVGLVLLSMRASFVTILAVCAGIWVIFNAGTLVSTFRQ